MIDYLVALSTLLLALSLASERLVAIVKTIWPELTDENAERTLAEDRRRRIMVLVLAFLASWLTSSFLATNGFNPVGEIPIFKSAQGDHPLPVYIVALMCTGGSAFWSSVLGYANAVKDTKKQQAAQQRMIMRAARQAVKPEVPEFQ